MTLININYKYISGSKDPSDIIGKYRQRGYSTILNKEEILYVLGKWSENEKWKNLYELNSKNKKKYKAMLGYISINRNIFNFNNNINKLTKKENNIYNISIDEYIKHILNIDVNNIYIYRTILTFLNLNIINELGYINKINKYYFELIYDKFL